MRVASGKNTLQALHEAHTAAAAIGRPSRAETLPLIVTARSAFIGRCTGPCATTSCAGRPAVFAGLLALFTNDSPNIANGNAHSNAYPSTRTRLRRSPLIRSSYNADPGRLGEIRATAGRPLRTNHSRVA